MSSARRVATVLRAKNVNPDMATQGQADEKPGLQQRRLHASRLTVKTSGFSYPEIETESDESYSPEIKMDSQASAAPALEMPITENAPAVRPIASCYMSGYELNLNDINSADFFLSDDESDAESAHTFGHSPHASSLIKLLGLDKSPTSGSLDDELTSLTNFLSNSKSISYQNPRNESLELTGHHKPSSGLISNLNLSIEENELKNFRGHDFEGTFVAATYASAEPAYAQYATIITDFFNAAKRVRQEEIKPVAEMDVLTPAMRR